MSGGNIFPGNFPTIQLPTCMESLWLYILKAFAICCPLVVREISSHLSTAKWLEDKLSGFPRGQSGWESSCQCRGHRFDPWCKKTPLAVEQLSPCTTTTKASWHNWGSPCTLELMLHGNEKPYTMTKSSSQSPQLEQTLTWQQRPSAAKNKCLQKHVFKKKSSGKSMDMGLWALHWTLSYAHFQLFDFEQVM